MCKLFTSGTTASQSRLDNLTAGMVKKSSTSSPKLRCKAGEARCLIPWIADACRDFLGNSAEHRTATEAGQYLAECYSCLSHECFDRDKLSSSARRFMILYGRFYMGVWLACAQTKWFGDASLNYTYGCTSVKKVWIAQLSIGCTVTKILEEPLPI